MYIPSIQANTKFILKIFMIIITENRFASKIESCLYQVQYLVMCYLDSSTIKRQQHPPKKRENTQYYLSSTCKIGRRDRK